MSCTDEPTTDAFSTPGSVLSETSVQLDMPPRRLPPIHIKHKNIEHKKKHKFGAQAFSSRLNRKFHQSANQQLVQQRVQVVPSVSCWTWRRTVNSPSSITCLARLRSSSMTCLSQQECPIITSRKKDSTSRANWIQLPPIIVITHNLCTIGMRPDCGPGMLNTSCQWKSHSYYYK